MSCGVKVLHDAGSGTYSVVVLVTWGCQVLIAAATAKSLQECPILGFLVPGILQARTLEWVAISFSKA